MDKSYILRMGIISLFITLFFIYNAYLALFTIIIGAILLAYLIFSEKRAQKQADQYYLNLAKTLSKEAKEKIKSITLTRPIYSILIYKFNENPRKKASLPKPLTTLLRDKLNFKFINNSLYMLLPKDMPKIDKNFSIESWTKRNIISRLPKDHTYTLNFVALVDLRKLFSYKTVSYGTTVFDKLLEDETFVAEMLRATPLQT